jgi:two-component system, response regulator YesN
MLKVLLVDDEPYVLEGLKVMIDWSAHGFKVCGEASNGEDALELVKMCNPDLVITDIKMPGMDGLEFIRLSCQKLHSTAKFVILSGYDEFSFARKAMLYNVSNYLLKPLDCEELDVVISKLTIQIKEERRKTENINSQLSFVTSQSIRRVLKGENKSSLINRISILLSISQEGEAKCILFEVESLKSWLQVNDEIELSTKKDKARRIIEAALGPVFQFHLFEDDKGRFGIIVCDKMPFYQSLESFASGLLLQLKHSLGESVFTAVSASGKGPAVLYEIYKQAVYALNLKFYLGNDSVINYIDVKDMNLNYGLYMENLNVLLEYVRTNQNKEIIKMVKQLFDYFSKSLTAPQIIITYIKNFQLEMVKIIMEDNKDLKESLYQEFEFDKNLDNLTLHALQESFLKQCLCAAAYINNLKQANPQQIICEVKNYIKQNYFEDIKLKQVARQFYMNSVYLGQLFKRVTGMQFNDYLNTVRIEEAKKLLRQTDMKILEITRAVGYNDPKYFLCKFKSITSLPPSAFKTGNQKILEGENEK